jgi:WD40 repeat protein
VFYANDRRILSTCEDVRVWDVETTQCLYVLQGHTEFIRTCKLSGDEQYLLSTSEDKTARVWDLTSGTCRQTFDGHTHWVITGCFVRKDTWIASIDMNYTICVWRISDAQCMYQLQNYNFSLPLQYSYWLARKNTECIIVSTKTKPYEIHVLSVESGEKIFTIQGYDTRVQVMCVSSDGRYLFSGDRAGKIKMVTFSKQYTN